MLSENVGGTFCTLTLFNTATYQELLDCNHTKAHNFKREQERKTMQIGVRNEPHCQKENLLHFCFFGKRGGGILWGEKTQLWKEMLIEAMHTTIEIKGKEKKTCRAMHNTLGSFEHSGFGPIVYRYPGLLTYQHIWPQGAWNLPSKLPLNMPI